MREKKNDIRFISSFTLHILAMGFMLLDHMWATVMYGSFWMTCVGRLAFPIFAFMLAEGFFHTRDRKKYMRRLLVSAAISEIPFNMMMGGGALYPFHQNVIWTFIIAFLCMNWLEKLKTRENKLVAAILAALVIAGGWLVGTVTMVDYGGAGVLTVLVFYLLRGERLWQRAGQLAGLFVINYIMIGGMTIPLTVLGHAFELPQQALALLAYPIILLYNGKQGPHSKPIQLCFYAFYPAHILALVIISLVL